VAYIILLLVLFMVLGMTRNRLRGYAYIIMGGAIVAYVIYAYTHPQ
jgi:hypothetical protein